jgi:ABC-type glycerol-3-phosphate transport system permease component
MGDHFQDIGLIATGVMISVIPVIVVYMFFSERLIRGMTAGAIK